jgi:hypothetical protein
MDFMRKLILPLVLLAFAGCSGAEPPPKTTKVEGTVTYKGAPLPKGKVSLEPEAPGDKKNPTRPATGAIENGKFTVSTFVQGDGAIPGTYRVAVESVEEVSMEDFNAGKREKQLIPKKFASGKTSGLALKIPDQSEPYAATLDLKD